MPRRFLRPRALAAVLVFGLLVAVPGVFQASPQGAARVVAIGDIHGAGDNFQAILRQAGLVDDRLNWAGGSATLVQTGDCFDRGAQVRQVLDLLMRLQPQAAAAGGRVVTLLGNHEIMNMLGVTRDVNPEIYAGFVDAQSASRRERAYADYVKVSDARARALGARPEVYALSREQWMAAHPPGYLEYRASLLPDGRYGKWLRTHDAAVMIDRTVFMHAGLNPGNAARTIADLNAQVRGDLAASDANRQVLADRGLILPFFTLNEIAAAAQGEIVSLNAANDAAMAGDQQAAARLRAADPRLVEALRGVTTVGESSLLAADGPMWFRGFAMWTSAEGEPRIELLLGLYGADRFVVGHTTMRSGRIDMRLGGHVFLIDTGMLTSYYAGGHPSALSIAPSGITAIYLDSTVPLSRSSGTPTAAVAR